MCKAESNNRCPFGEVNHANTLKGAREIFENLMTARLFVKSIREISIHDEKIFPMYAANKNKNPDLMDLSAIHKEVKSRKVLCPDCGTPLGGAWSGLTAIHMEGADLGGFCFKCKKEFNSMDDAPPIRENPDSPTYPAVEIENIPKMTWYHFTTRDEWAEDILKPQGRPKFIHLGGESAAADRGISNGSGLDKNYMYAVEIIDTEDADPTIFDDDGSDFNPNGDYKIVRYRNRYEDSGSISLAVRPEKIRILGRAKVNKDQLMKIGTYPYKIPPSIFHIDEVENFSSETLTKRINKYNDLFKSEGSEAAEIVLNESIYNY